MIAFSLEGGHKMRRFVVCLFFAAFPIHAAVINVEGPQDSLAGAPTINHCTLRKAIINSNTNAATYPQCVGGSGIDTITFNSPFVITFALAGANEDAGLTGDLDITESVIIDGGGAIIDGANLDRIFHINPSGASPITVTIRNITLRNGSGASGGGGILAVNSNLNLENVTITGCHTSGGDGGAIWTMSGGTLNMTNCTLDGNFSSTGHAGAIVTEATTNITSCTITNNNPGFSNLTGGVRALGAVTLRNTIVAGNGGTEIPNLDGTFTSAGYNIIGNLGTRADNPTIVATTGDQIGVSFASINLGSLQDNGGPVATRALQSGSIAIDKGHSSGSSVDARGLTRPCDLASVANATGGDGADVGAFEVQGACSATNTDPVANDDNATILEDAGAFAINVLGNDTDAELNTLTITGVTQGANGSVAITGGGTGLTYTPNANYNGPESFTYTISDGNGGVATATVHITVVPVNDPPVAHDDSTTVNQDTMNNIINVLANDTDIDGDLLHLSFVSAAAHGSVINNGTSVSYTPNPSFAGNDSFTYKANDGTVDSNSATVMIHVLDTQPPTINASVATTQLWPPNHDLVNVGFSVNVTDNGGGALTTSLAVFSNEDDLTLANGDQSPDAKDTFRLRAERDANGNGRVYLIRVMSTDSSANTAKKCVTVTVPKSLSAADVANVNALATSLRTTCSAAGLFVVGDGPVVGPKQ